MDVEDWSCRASFGLSVWELNIDIVGLPRKVDPSGLEKYFTLEVIHKHIAQAQFALFFAFGEGFNPPA